MTNGARRKPPAAGMGRKKGTPNKSTAAVKQALTLAFQGIGGVPQLQEWATENPTEFYKLWAKLLPVEVASDPDRPFTIRVTFDQPQSL